MRNRIAFFFWWLFWCSAVVLLLAGSDEYYGAILAAITDLCYILYLFIRTDYDSTIALLYHPVVIILLLDVILSALITHSPIVFYVIGPCILFYIYSEGVSSYATK